MPQTKAFEIIPLQTKRKENNWKTEEDRETARMRKYGERKTTRIMMAPVPHVTA